MDDALRFRLDQQGTGTRRIDAFANSDCQQAPGIELGRRQPTLGGKLIPSQRRFGTAVDSAARLMDLAEIVLRVGISLFGRQRIQA